MKNYVLTNPEEKPLDTLLSDGGFCGIFRTMACIGDSLSSGEFESKNEEGYVGYHDLFEYSWGQYIARMCGNQVYNFSRGGMTAKEYCESYAALKGWWDPDKKCQAYIIALGVNDVSCAVNNGIEMGEMTDIDFDDYRNNKKTFAGYYAQIIQRMKEIQPKAKFFLMTMPDSKTDDPKRIPYKEKHTELLYAMAEQFEYTYVLDFQKYTPIHDEDYVKNFRLAGHLNPMGYMQTAKMVVSYIDYIIRNHPEDFAQVGFIGTPWHHCEAKW